MSSLISVWTLLYFDLPVAITMKSTKWVLTWYNLNCSHICIHSGSPNKGFEITNINNINNEMTKQCVKTKPWKARDYCITKTCINIVVVVSFKFESMLLGSKKRNNLLKCLCIKENEAVYHLLMKTLTFFR